MDLASLYKQNKALRAQHILPLLKAIKGLEELPKQELQDISYQLDEIITIHLPHASAQTLHTIKHLAQMLKPWRKGPFCINDIEIQSEWNSAIKYNILQPHLHAEQKIIADVGCNNGYYLLRLSKHNPQKLIGFDPMPLCKLQFDFLQFFIQDSRLCFELLGIEELNDYPIAFDMIFCLGVLYHRRDPLSSIKIIYNQLKKGGEAFFDSIIIPGQEPIALCPNGRYAQMKNVYFIPTLSTFIHWLERCGFKNIIHLGTLKTTTQEQRKTPWSSQQSLEDFLDPSQEQTIEGYPAPQRAYLKATKK